MAVLRNRCDLIGATYIPVAPRLIYKDSPDPIYTLGSGAARLGYVRLPRLLPYKPLEPKEPFLGASTPSTITLFEMY